MTEFIHAVRYNLIQRVHVARLDYRVRYMQNPENHEKCARAEKRPADGDYGAATARRECSEARGGIPMGSTAPMSLAVRAQLPQAVWGWL